MLRGSLGSSDRATALVTRSVTRTPGDRGAPVGTDEMRQRSRTCEGRRCVGPSRVVFLVFVMDDDGYGADRVPVVEHR